MTRTDTPRRILAVAPNWLGDAVMCTPALRALKNRFPDAELTVTGPPSVCDTLAGPAWIDRLYPLPHRAPAPALLRAARELAPFSRDLAVVFPHSFRAALLARLTGARRRIGYDRGGRRWLLTDRPAPHRENGVITPVYMVKEYLELIAPLGCSGDGRGPELAADPGECARIRGELGGGGPVVVVAPGAAFGPSKRWPAERFARAADLLAERRGARCVLVTGPGEEDTRAAVLAAAQRPLREFPGGGIARLKAVIAVSDLLLGNDSGPRHIAVALGRPVICVMGPTSPRHTEGPWERGRVLRVDVDCGPCQKPVCATDHRCMTQTTPEQAAEAAMEWL